MKIIDFIFIEFGVIIILLIVFSLGVLHGVNVMQKIWFDATKKFPNDKMSDWTTILKENKINIISFGRKRYKKKHKI